MIMGRNFGDFFYVSSGRSQMNKTTAVNAMINPNIKVISGATFCHKNPAIRLAGSAIRPMVVWNAPKAVALNSSLDKSDTNAL